MTKKRMRKYAPLWDAIKTNKIISTQLHPLSMTPEQAEKVAAGFRRAISKEKYEDIHFKDKYPAATLEFKYDGSTRTLTFTLSLNTPESRAEEAIKNL